MAVYTDLKSERLCNNIEPRAFYYLLCNGAAADRTTAVNEANSGNLVNVCRDDTHFNIRNVSHGATHF